MNHDLGQPGQSGLRRLPDIQLNVLLKRQEVAWQKGTPLEVEALLKIANVETYENFDIDQLLTLICGEVLARESVKQQPSLAEYQLRFPRRAEELGIQWEIDKLLSYQTFDTGQRDMRATVAGHGNESPQNLPETIGRYEIFSELGRGSMGLVYEAWDPQLKRRLAIKRLRGGRDSSAEDLRRIRMEAEAIARIRHNNIVQIYEVGEAEGMPYLAMEFCEGGSLADRLKGGPLSPKLAAQVVNQVALGVAAAHACRIIHRDLKPGNVLLGKPGSWIPQVNDFGLAKNLDSEISSTAIGSIMGTPAYMSPEQASGDNRLIGPASDVYSIGAILYECLTGRPPFSGVTVGETLDHVRRREPVAVRHSQPGVPFDLETITHKCLRKEITHRYQSVQALADDLQRYLDQRPIQARRQNWFESVMRTARRYPLSSSLALTSVLLLLVIAIGSLTFAGRLSVALEKSQLAERNARLEQAEAIVGRAHGIRLSRQPGQRLDALATIAEAQKIGVSLRQPAEWFETMRDDAIAALMLHDAHVEEYRDEEYDIHYADFSDDHQLYALSFAVGDISVRRMSDHVEVTRLPRFDETVAVMFVGTDQLLLLGHQSGKFEKWNVGISPPQRVWQHESGFKAMALSPDQQTIAVTDSRTIQLVRLSDGAVLNRLEAKPFLRGNELVMHPTHPYLCLYSYFQPGMEIRNWQTGETLIRYSNPDNVNESFGGADWSPDGKQFVLNSGDSNVLSWFEFDPETATMTLERSQASSEMGQGGFTFNARGDRLWNNGWGNQVNIVEVVQGKSVVKSYSTLGLFFRGFPKRDPLGNLAGFYRLPGQNNKRRIGPMRVADHSESNLLVPASSGFGSATFDPLSRFVVVRDTNGLSFFCPYTRRRLLKLDISGLKIFAFSWAGDEEMIVNASTGCFRWPYRYDDQANRIEFGIPRRILIPSGTGWVSASRNGKTVASGCWEGYGTQEYAGIWIKAESEPAARKVIGQQSAVATAVSPDGRWVVAPYAGTTIFDGRDPAKIIHQLHSEGTASFSDDGSWLMAGEKLINTATWEAEPGFDEGVLHQMTSDGKQLLSYLPSNVDVLTDAKTGRVFARLPNGEYGPSVLSPHGDMLLALHENGVYITDMQAIAAGLKKLGLPWDGPDYDQLEPTRPLDSVGIHSALAGIDTAAKLYQWIDAESLKRSDASPEDGQLQFDAAMVRLRERDLDRALKHLDRTCELLPEAVTARQWRACVLAELRRWKEAISDADWVLQTIDEPDFQLLRAEWLVHHGEFVRAIEDCNDLIDRQQKLVSDSLALRGYCLKKTNKEIAATADKQEYNERVGLHLESLNLAAFPMVGPDISLRHPILAQLYVDQMLESQQELLPYIRDTVGLTLYRNDRYEECLAAMQQNLADEKNYCYPYAAITVAMCEAKLGNLESARKYLQQSESWNGKFSTYLEQRDYDLLYAEAIKIFDEARVAE